MNPTTPAPAAIAAFAAIREATARPRRTAGADLGEWDVLAHPDAETFYPVYLRVTGAHTADGQRVVSARVIGADGEITGARVLFSLPTDTVVTTWVMVAA